MAKNKWNSLNSLGGLVYSTNPDYKPQEEPEPEAVDAAMQDVRIWLETKHRGGKAASVIKGFVGTAAQLEELSRQLKSHCGTGGTAKDGEIIIQGDHRDKILLWLQKNGYKKAKKAGG